MTLISSTRHEDQSVPPDAKAAWNKAVALFNAGQYWETHEALEAVWLRCEGHQRRFLAGVILLASALHKRHRQGAAAPAWRLHGRALRHLEGLPPRFWGINARELAARVAEALDDPGRAPRLDAAGLE